VATPNGVKMLMLVDDEPAQRRFIAALASRGGWRTIFASSTETAIAMLGTQDGMMLDAVLFDHSVPGYEITEFLADMRARRPSLPLMLLTPEGSMDIAVEALKAGASDYFLKPVAPSLLLSALEAAVADQGTMNGLLPFSEKISPALPFEEIIGSTPAFRSVLAIAAKAARARAAMLIEGESGTGRQLLAQAIHMASPRSKGPFIQVDCRQMSGNLIASTLFGHQRGAFPGAFDDQTGKLQQADGGTLYLAAVEHLPMDAQMRLIDLLETGDVQPIGSAMRYPVDVRLITSSLPELKRAVDDGDFREDLYFRMAQVQIDMPPLRQRSGDLPALSRHILSRLGAFPGMRRLGITDDALSLMGSFDWPHNVRQLHDVLFRAALNTEGDAITIADLRAISEWLDQAPLGHAAGANNSVEGIGVTLYANDGHLRPLEEIEADVIRLAIGHYRGRMSEVARRLGIGRSTLYRKLADLGIDTAA
jgi:DNA-binding NtrC family response regulator